ncbi:phage tail tape measure protein [Sodalis sp. RH24]|uniref:phage tail tape measure protein n=1 Tax=unclassified Sodalis (in: enterobacteria) TaxID=2636512 RepID=UPI0039B4FDFC
MADSFQLKALITGVDRLSPALTRMQKNIRSFRKNLSKGAEGAIPMAAGLAAGLTGAMVAYAKTENAATGLKVAMMDASGATGDSFEKINKLAVGLGNKLPGTTADFQNMMQMLVRQGIPAENILNGVGEASAYLAVQLKKTPEDAAEFAAKMQDATGTASKDMMGLFDTIQRAFYMGVDDTNMLAFFTKTSSVMKMVSKDGLTAAKALAPISVMMDQMGMQGEAAGNALRKIFQGGFDSKKMNAANKLLSRKGIKLDFTNGKGEFGGLDNMFVQLQKLQSLTTKQKTTIIKQIFGDDAETLQVLGALIDKGKAGYDDIAKRMIKQASLQKRVDEQLGTLTNLWDAMTGTAVNGLAAIGGAFAGNTKDTVKWMGDMAARFSDFAAANPAVIRGVVGLAAGFVAFKLALFGANIAMGLLSKTMGMSPLGVMIRVIAMGAGLIMANWGVIGPWFENMWPKVVIATTNAWNGIKAFFSEFWEGTKAVFEAGFGVIKQLFLDYTPLGQIIKNWEPIVDWFKNMWERIRPYIEPVMNGMDKIKGVAGKSWNYFFGDDEDAAAEGQGKSAPNISTNTTNQYLKPGQNNINGEMTVRFENAPPGMKVQDSKTNQSGFGLGYDVGYNRFSFK